MRSKMSVIIGILLAASVAGCAHSCPPGSVVQDIQAVKRYAPEYVAEANKAFEQTRHPDAERLCGIGERLAEALDALEQWAAKQEAADESR